MRAGDGKGEGGGRLVVGEEVEEGRVGRCARL